MNSLSCLSFVEPAQAWSALQRKGSNCSIACATAQSWPLQKLGSSGPYGSIVAPVGKQAIGNKARQPGFYLQATGHAVKSHSTRAHWRLNAASASAVHPGGGSDSELRDALALASDEELHELVNILYGKSPLSPLLKSIATGDGSSSDSDEGVSGHPKKDFSQMLSEREALLRRLEARFFFLAADAKATMMGKRPSYRQVLLCVRQKLRVPCSNQLATADLEAEIFLHLLQEYSSAPSKQKEHEQGVVLVNDPKRVEGRQWHRLGKLLAPVKIGGEEVLSILAKGSSAIGVTTLQNMALGRLSGRMLMERAKYQVATEALKKGGAAVANRIQSHYAVLAAKQAFAGASARYAILRSTMRLLGPVMWGAFMADVVLQAVGTDYGRVVRVIFALAQIRLTRTYGWTQSDTA